MVNLCYQFIAGFSVIYAFRLDAKCVQKLVELVKICTTICTVAFSVYVALTCSVVKVQHKRQKQNVKSVKWALQKLGHYRNGNHGVVKNASVSIH